MSAAGEGLTEPLLDSIESLIHIHKKRTPWVCSFSAFKERGIRTYFNAARMSAAGEG